MRGYLFLAVCLLLHGCISALTGEIKSCAGWKLNHLPQVKHFLKTSGHADAYDKLKITWIPGHTPTLILRDDAGVEIEKIDLSSHTTEQLHELMKSKGFERKAGGVVPGASLNNLRGS